jgi:hypothetical protein
MNSGGLTGGIYKPLSPEQVEWIHSEAYPYFPSAPV